MIFTFSLQGTSFFIRFLFVFYSFLMFKFKITINQVTGIECPNLGSQFGHSTPTVRAVSARYLFSRCPSLGLWVPVWWAQADRLTGWQTILWTLFLVLYHFPISYEHEYFIFFPMSMVFLSFFHAYFKHISAYFSSTKPDFDDTSPWFVSGSAFIPL